MAVAFDAVGPSSAGASSSASTSLTWSHTCTGSNRALLVGVAMGKGTDTGISTTATYNGVAMTSLGVIHTGGGTAGYVQLFGLANPASGANTVAITAAGGTPGTLAGGSVSGTGVDQTTPFGTPVTVASPGAGTSISASVTGTTSGNMVVSVVADGSGGETATTGTKRWNVFVDANSGAGSAAMSTIAAPGGTQAMSWTINNDFLGEIAVEVLAAGASSGAATLPRMPSPGRVAPGGRWAPFVGDTTTVGATTYPISVGGSLTPAGAPTRQPGKVLAGAATPGGGLARAVGKVLGGAVAPAGTAARQTQQVFAGGLTPAGALATLRLRVVALAGSVAPGGSLLKQTGKALAGSASPSGTLTKQTAKTFLGGLTPSGALASIRTRLLAVAGSLTPAGSLTRSPGKALTAALAPDGSLLRQTGKRVTGGITPAGALASTRIRVLAVAGSVASSGALRRSIGKALGGAATPAGVVTKSVAVRFLGALAPAGFAAKLVARLFAGSVPSSGSATASNLGVVVPIIDYPIRAGTVDDLSTSRAAGSVTDLSTPNAAGSVVDSAARYHAGTST